MFSHLHKLCNQVLQLKRRLPRLPTGPGDLLPEPDALQPGPGRLGEGVPPDGELQAAGRVAALHAPGAAAHGRRPLHPPEVLRLQLRQLRPERVRRRVPGGPCVRRPSSRV